MAANKILLIDDDEDDVEFLSNALLQSGLDHLHYVSSAIKAFMYLEGLERNNLPDLIVTDLYLPGMSGAEFLKDLKRMDKYKHIPVVVMTNLKTSEEIERYKELGAIDYLQKPSCYAEYQLVASAIKAKVSSA